MILLLAELARAREFALRKLLDTTSPLLGLLRVLGEVGLEEMWVNEEAVVDVVILVGTAAARAGKTGKRLGRWLWGGGGSSSGDGFTFLDNLLVVVKLLSGGQRGNTAVGIAHFAQWIRCKWCKVWLGIAGWLIDTDFRF